MYIPIPKDNYSEGLPVKFTKDDGSHWIANFEYDLANISLNHISVLSSTNEILVLAKNIAYIINRNDESPVIAFKGYFENIFLHNEFSVLITIDCIIIIKNSNQIEFIDYLHYAFVSDVSLRNGLIEVYLDEFSALSNTKEKNYLINLGEIDFSDFNSNDYYKRNKI